MSGQDYEPLLDESKFRLTMFPIEHKDIWDMYKKQLASFWKSEEIDFSKDYDDFVKLSPDEQHFIKMTLAFFASSDNIVNFNLSERFTKEVKCQEALVCYQYQMMMENIHSECYSIMLESLIKDPIEKQNLFNAVSTVPAVKLMKDWAYKWIDSDKSFAHRLIAFACIEGIFFSSSFASIFWFKLFNNKGKSIMPGLVDSNQIILRDESQHTNFACLLYSKIVNRLSSEEVKNIVKDAVGIAQNFANESLPVRLIGMNSELMCKYLEYIADRLIVDLGYEKIYNSTNPFPFMQSIGMISKSNFFEKIELSYQSSSNANNNKALSNLVISDDF
jgi:ribonucleotide reductase beta subunit family protein with ferritin-like domain